MGIELDDIREGDEVTLEKLIKIKNALYEDVNKEYRDKDGKLIDCAERRKKIRRIKRRMEVKILELPEYYQSIKVL